MTENCVIWRKSNKNFFELCDLGESWSLPLVAFFWIKSGFWSSRKLLLKKRLLRFLHFLVRYSLVYTTLYYKKVNLTSFWKSGRMTRHFGTYCFISHQQPNAVITFDCLVFTTTTIREEKVGERFTMYHDASSSKMNDKQCGTCSALFSKDFLNNGSLCFIF